VTSKKKFWFGKVEYMFFRDPVQLSGEDFDRLPFVKRYGFKGEAKYRIIAESDYRQKPAYPIDIKLS
jgi:hypothetical protein